MILDNVIGFWQYDDHMNHDNDDAGINVPNDIETLMMLMIPIVIITMMVKRWRKKGQLCKSKQRQRRQR